MPSPGFAFGVGGRMMKAVARHRHDGAVGAAGDRRALWRRGRLFQVPSTRSPSASQMTRSVRMDDEALGRSRRRLFGRADMGERVADRLVVDIDGRRVLMAAAFERHAVA